MIKKSQLTLIKKLNKKHKDGSFLYLCKCSCGNLKEVHGGKFKNNRVLSCGCLRGKDGKHFLSNHRLYDRYRMIIARCYNKKNISYSNYGKRGIKVCDRWKEPLPQGFLNFIQDMGEPIGEVSIERINNNGNYCLENCKWVKIDIQANNKRNNLLLEFKGEVRTLAQWMKLFNTSAYRIKKAFSKFKNDIDNVKKYCSSKLTYKSIDKEL